jgi:hypothetical protein
MRLVDPAVDFSSLLFNHRNKGISARDVRSLKRRTSVVCVRAIKGALQSSAASSASILSSSA